jgi:hypothetical protein
VLERVGCVSPIERQPSPLHPTKPPSQIPSTQSRTRCRSAISLRGAHRCRYVCPAPIRRTYTPHDAYRTPALHSQPQFPAPSPIERPLTRKIRNAFSTPLLLLTGSHARARARPKRCFFFSCGSCPCLCRFSVACRVRWMTACVERALRLCGCWILGAAGC